MRPGVPSWETNSVWAGGPSVGQPTKTAPTTGQRGEGYYPTYRPAPQTWNWREWELSLHSQALRLMRVANWEQVDIAGCVAAGFAGEGYYEPTTQRHVIEVIRSDIP